MGTVYVNGEAIDIGDERLNVIQAASKAGVFVPHYCWHPELTVVASCRMCLVEVGERQDDGSDRMMPRLVPGCQTPAKDKTVIRTNSPKAEFGQKQTLEGILLNHPLDCPVCDKAGECGLQDYSYRYGKSESRMIDQKNTPPNKPDIGDNVSLFTDRCIMCSRCVRFTREISGTAELHVVNRGNHSEIDIFPELPINNKLATNVVDLCPVGALCSNDFLYQHRVWNLKTKSSVCPDCSTGCSIHLDTNKNIVYRLRPRVNPQAQGHFMCDDGRLGYHYINSAERFRKPMTRRNGEPEHVPWRNLVAELREAFESAVAKDASHVVAVMSPFLTCEEAYLLAKYFKGLSPDTKLAMGAVPVVGEDDTYPKDWKGDPKEDVRFTIRAEKCPNRRGVEEVLKHFQGEVIGFDEVVRLADAGDVDAVYLAMSSPPRLGGWVNEEQAETLKKVPVIVCHDLFASPVSVFAKYVLPGSSFAEKDGTFVNHANLAQAIHWGVVPVGECRTEGQVFLDLLERRGLVHAPTLRAELAEEIAFFAPLREELGELGTKLGETS